MSKRFFSAIALSVVTALLIPLAVNASEPQQQLENGIARTAVYGNEVVSILNDGRISGIKQPEKLSEENRHQLLKLLNFTDEDIASYPDTLQYDLLRDGGRKVNTNISNVQHFVSRNGVVELVDDVEAAPSGGFTIMGMGSLTSGNFTGTGLLTYVGTTTTEYEYKYRTKFNWSSKPALCFVDTVGISWNATSVPVGTIGLDYRRFDSGFFSHTNKISASQDLVNGVTARIDIQNSPGEHFGHVERQVRIAKTRVGLTEVFGSAYGHSWLPDGIDNVGVTIGWASFTFGGTGDYFTWTNDFTVGSTS